VNNGLTILESISGVIENVVYHNDDNDYCVIEIVDSDNNLITAVGTMPMAFEGECVELSGTWTFHKEFGRQFAFDSYEKSLPNEVDGILQYLSSKTVKGIGPVTALKIVNKFGVDTFVVIENHPEWLADIHGITMKKAAAISESFKEQSGIRNVMMFCKDYLDKGEVATVYKRFGAGAVGIIKENPYILCSGGISFEKADAIAKSFEVPKNSRERILAAYRYVLSYNATTNGHTCLPKNKLVLAAASVLELTVEEIEPVLDVIISDGELAKHVTDEHTYVMSYDVAQNESYIASRINEMDKYINHFGASDIYLMIEKVESRLGIKYAALQKEAIFKALGGSFMILTGGPGTGKTTIVKGLLSIFNSIGQR
jgi:exodeoxyribonuclease V alpha subunit